MFINILWRVMHNLKNSKNEKLIFSHYKFSILMLRALLYIYVTWEEIKRWFLRKVRIFYPIKLNKPFHKCQIRLEKPLGNLEAWWKNRVEAVFFFYFTFSAETICMYREALRLFCQDASVEFIGFFLIN